MINISTATYMESDKNFVKEHKDDEPFKCPFIDKPWYACIEYCGYQCITIDAPEKVSAHIHKTKVSSDVLNGWNLP